MNLKNETQINSNSSLLINIADERIAKLEIKIQTLNQICDELNPYQEIPQEFKIKLNTFGIYDFSNPFQLTNTLVTLLEDAIEELHQLKPVANHEEF